jgi:glutaredoxin 3
MPKIDMYTTAICPYCVAAKNLLKRKGIADVNEMRIDMDDGKRQEMMTRSGGRRTVPQIFINDYHVGGCDDLSALDRAGKLDPLLSL